MTRILKISAPLVAALLIAAAIGSAHARPNFILSPNGISPNGISPNGSSPNGVSPNGVASPSAQVKSIKLPNGASYSAR